MFVSRQIKDSVTLVEPLTGADTTEPAAITVWNRMLGVGGKIARFVGVAEKGITTADQLTQDVHHLIEAAGRLSG